MGNSSPPFLYGPPDAYSFKGPTDHSFNPKAVTQASWTRPPPKKKQKGPLVSFNRHPDSVCANTQPSDQVYTDADYSTVQQLSRWPLQLDTDELEDKAKGLYWSEDTAWATSSVIDWRAGIVVLRNCYPECRAFDYVDCPHWGEPRPPQFCVVHY